MLYHGTGMQKLLNIWPPAENLAQTDHVICWALPGLSAPLTCAGLHHTCIEKEIRTDGHIDSSYTDPSWQLLSDRLDHLIEGLCKRWSMTRSIESQAPGGFLVKQNKCSVFYSWTNPLMRTRTHSNSWKVSSCFALTCTWLGMTHVVNFLM